MGQPLTFHPLVIRKIYVVLIPGIIKQAAIKEKLGRISYHMMAATLASYVVHYVRPQIRVTFLDQHAQRAQAMSH